MTMYKLLSSLNPSDVSKRRNCVEHLSVHDGVQCVRRAELLKVGESQRGSAIFSGAGKARSMLTLMSTEHELLALLRSLDFTDTIEEFAFAMARIRSHVSATLLQKPYTSPPIKSTSSNNNHLLQQKNTSSKRIHTSSNKIDLLQK